MVLHTLGQCLIRTAITSISPRADMCFAIGAYLTRQRGTRTSRRLFEAMFWPGVGGREASHRLSELIRKLRRKGVPIQADDAACIWLPRDAVAVDVETLAEQPASEIAGRDLSILPGYSSLAPPALRDWVDDWRNQLQLNLLDQLVVAADRAIADNLITSARDLAGHALRMDPDHERARAIVAIVSGRSRHRPSLTAPTRARLAVRECDMRNAVGDRSERLLENALNDRIPLVGRQREVDLLTNQANEALAGRVRCVYLSGRAGVGKSRLAEEISLDFRAAGGIVTAVYCARHDLSRPFSAFMQLVPRLLALPGAAGCHRSTLECLERFSVGAGQAFGDGFHRETINVAESIRAAMLDLVNAVSDEQPLGLVIEDLQWLDASSWDLLRTIAGLAQRSLFLVCTSRARWKYQEWAEPGPFLVVELGNLTPADARDLFLCELSRENTHADTPIVDWHIARSGCNPFFVRELARAWALNRTVLAYPPNLFALIKTRIASLNPCALHVIQAAAILGTHSCLDYIEAMLAYPTHRLLTAMEELAEADLIASGHDGLVANIACRHDIISEAVLQGTPPATKQTLHVAAARAVEAGRSRRDASSFFDAAEHWLAAGRNEEFIASTVDCVKQLLVIGQLDTAMQCVGDALAHCQTDGARLQVLRVRAQTEFTARAWPEFLLTVSEVRHIERFRAIDKSAHDDMELAELVAERCTQRDWTRTLSHALECAQADGVDAPHRVGAAICALKLASNLGDLDTMKRVYAAVRGLSLEPSVTETRRLTLTVVHDTICGELSSAVTAARRLLHLSDRPEPHLADLPVLLDCVTSLRRGGAEGESEDVCARLLEAALQHRSHEIADAAFTHLMEMHLDADHIAEALNLKRARARWSAGTQVESPPAARIALARLHTRLGQWKQARRLLAPRGGKSLCCDNVPLARSAALATMVRVECGVNAKRVAVERLLQDLVPTQARFQSIGAQDYETCSVALAQRYIGDTDSADRTIRNYIATSRRDQRKVSCELANELERIASKTATRVVSAALPGCEGATGAKSA